MLGAFEVKHPNGDLDDVTTGWLLRAYDIAVQFGHANVQCAHLAMAIAADPVSGRDYVLTAIRAKLPNFNAPAALQACAKHLLVDDAKPVMATEPAIITVDPDLKAWFTSARALIEHRSPIARYVEAEQIITAASTSEVEAVKLAWHLLQAAKPKSMETLFGETQTATQKWVDGGTQIVTGAIGGYTTAHNTHAATAETVAKERYEHLVKIVGAMHGDIVRQVEDLDQKTQAQSEKTHKKIDALGASVCRHREETAHGLATNSGMLVAESAGVAILVTGVDETAKGLHARSLPRSLTVLSLLLALGCGTAIGYFLR